MPFVRCKFYSESGDPLGSGCRRKGAGCAFVHPGDPNWASAPPSFQSRDRSGDSSSFKSRGDRGRQSAPVASGWNTGSTSAPDKSSGWDTGGDSGGGWGGGWGTNHERDTTSGWDTGGGWDAGGSVSTPNPASDTSRVKKPSTTSWDTGGGWDTGPNPTSDTPRVKKPSTASWDIGGGWDTGGSVSTPNSASDATRVKKPSTNSRDASRSRRQSDATPAPKASGDGWGNKASGWGSAGNDGWGTSSWGADKDTDKNAASGWGSSGKGEWGTSGWGDNKGADKTSGWGSGSNEWGTSGWGDKDADANAGSARDNTRDDGWKAGRGSDNNATSSWGASEPMVVEKRAERGTERSKGKGKAVIAPPRIRIPENDHKKTKITGTNNEPLGSSRWGESRSSISVTTPIPVTTPTPIAVSTPTDSIRPKRKRDVAFDDKLDVFKEYIKTWERAVRARFLLAEAEVKRDRWFRTQKSACYARIGEAGRKRLDGQRAECDKEVSSQREKLSSAITSLVEFHDTISSNMDLNQRYNVGEETQKFISESKAFVDDARALLVACVLKDKDNAQSSETDGTPIDALRRQVRDFEERFQQAQTELTLRHQRNIRSEIDELLSEKILALRAARQSEIDRVASQPRPEIEIPPSALTNMDKTVQQVSEMETKVPHTVEDIRILLFRVDAMTKRVSELEEEVSMNKETYRKVQEMAAEKEETERRMDRQLQNVREQFQQLLASQPLEPITQPAVSPISELQEKLMESLRPSFETVLDKFYEQEVRPTITSLQQVVIEASDRHQEEAIKVLWGKIQPAMNMVAGVSRWLDSQELRLTAPVEQDQALG